jgi:hypothetical protein
MFDRYKNSDGKTYNGAAMMSELTGLTVEEITWMSNRIRELVQSGSTKESVIAIVKAESKNKPWIKP